MGKVSETVVVPAVANEPAALLTVMSHSPVPPCVKVPMCVFETDREGGGSTFSVAIACLLFP